MLIINKYGVSLEKEPLNYTPMKALYYFGVRVILFLSCLPRSVMCLLVGFRLSASYL